MAEHQYTQQPKKMDNTSQKQTLSQKQIPISHPAAIIQRVRINPKYLTHADVMQLQRTIGNRAVGRLLSEIGLISTKSKQASPVQMQKIPEEEKESLQGKIAEAIQRKVMPEDEEPLQGKMIGTIQRQERGEEENHTGMPDNLKAGVESLSGMDMSDVRVHYNSSKPAEVGAMAYTKGTDIHVAPGQERHLPHEAWHVVQQAQDRVRPTMQLKGVAVNDDVTLEKEADMMGRKIPFLSIQHTTSFSKINQQTSKTLLIQKKIDTSGIKDYPKIQQAIINFSKIEQEDITTEEFQSLKEGYNRFIPLLGRFSLAQNTDLILKVERTAIALAQTSLHGKMQEGWINYDRNKDKFIQGLKAGEINDFAIIIIFSKTTADSKDQFSNNKVGVWQQVFTHEMAVHAENMLDLIEEYQNKQVRALPKVDEEHRVFKEGKNPRYEYMSSRSREVEGFMSRERDDKAAL